MLQLSQLQDLPGVDDMAEIRMTLEEYEALRRLITSERESEGSELSARSQKTPAAKPRRKNPKLKRALKLANSQLRTKAGKLRKGVSQGDIMKRAHKLMKKM